MGNELKRLDTPNISTIFVGILIGILFGSIPVMIPGVPTPMKLDWPEARWLLLF